ncbi:MAG: hypothetical protein GY785_25660 [Gammaproteobacteria bacterium]|nr:hypothetical protein [Gammaproteobacteria bacterium]MCP5093583.1 hypothetical protein [Gammaproteobacteria bacterium]
MLLVQQTSLAQQDKDDLQEYADQNQMLYQDLWVEAIDRFLETREGMLKRGVRVSYFAGATDAVAWNMKLPKSLVSKVKRVAKADYASARRLYYTALMQYMDQHINQNK